VPSVHLAVQERPPFEIVQFYLARVHSGVAENLIVVWRGGRAHEQPLETCPATRRQLNGRQPLLLLQPPRVLNQGTEYPDRTGDVGQCGCHAANPIATGSKSS
jgi:hypothetical protein